MIWELLLTALLAILSKLWRSACVKYCSLWRSEEGSWSAWLTLSVVVCGNVRSQCDSKSCTSTVCKIYIIPNRAIQSKCIYKYMYINVLSENVHVCVLHMFGLWCRLSYHLRRTHLFRSLHQRERNVGVSQAPWLSSDCLSSQGWIGHLYKRMRKILRYMYVYIVVF